MLERAGKAGQAQKAVVDALGQSSAGAVKDQSQLSTALHDLEQRFTAARNGGKSFATTIGESIDGAAAAMVRLVDGVVQGLNRINSASNVADQNARDLAAGRAGAAAAAASSAGGLAAQTGREVLLGPVIPGSSERAMGIMQLLPSTARGMGYNPAIPDENIAGGLTYLQQQTGQYGVEGGLARYGGYGSNVGGAAGYISKVQGQDVSKLPTDVSSSIEYWGQVLGLSDSQITLGKKMALQESGGRQYASSGASFALPAIDVTDVADRKDHQGATSAANRALLTDQRRLSDNLGNDTSGTRALGSLGSAADLVRVHDEMAIVNRQLAEMALHGDTTSTAFKQAAAQAAGLTQKEQELLAADRNRLDPQAQFLRGMQDQVAANAGLTEGDQRVLQLRQQMAQVERDQGGSFSPEQRTAALNQLSQQQQQDLARQIDGMRIATAGQDNLSAAYNQSYDAVAKTTAANQGYTAALKYGRTGSDERRAATAALTTEFERQAEAANKVAVAQATLQNKDQLTYINAETQSLGMNDDARSLYLDHLKAEQFLIGHNTGLTEEGRKSYLASADAISVATAAYKHQQGALQEVSGFFTNTFDTIANSITQAFATGNLQALKFKDIMKSVASAVIAEFAKLAVLNPLKNLLFGGNDQTLSSVAGVLGKLVGSGGGTTTVVGSAGTTGSSPFDALWSTGAAVTGAQTSATSAIGSAIVTGGKSLLSSITGGTISGLDSLGSWVVGQVAGTILGNLPEATNVALSAAGSGVYGVATAGEVAVGSASVATGLSTELISSAVSTVASALPAIGAAISIVTDLAQGNYRGAGLVAIGALIGTAILPGIGTAVGSVVGGLVDAFLPNHPKHPFENTELNVQGGQLVAGKTVGQLADTEGLQASTQKYADSINTYLASVGVKIQNADMNLGGIGQGITGMAQTLDPNTLFNRLSFGNDPNDTSQFGVAKGALSGMSFASPQALADELQKIAGFADATATLGITLKAVGKDISAIQIASVSGANPGATSTVTDASGQQISYHGDLRTALNADLPTQTLADTAALDAEMQKVSDFVTGTLPGLLTPIKATQSTLQDQYNAIRRQYDGANQQSKAYGLDNSSVLQDGLDKALTILMEPASRAIYTTMTAIEGRFNTLGGYAGGGVQAATLNNLSATQANERASFEDQFRQTWGDAVVASDGYKAALQSLIQTQNAETQATKDQLELARAQSLASLTASEADIAKRAGIDSLSQQLSAYDAKAQQETDSFLASWRAYYGEYSAVGEDFQNQMSALWLAHNNERLQIEQDYNAQSSTQASAAMKQAQGSVASLFGSIKDYVLKLQTGSQSALSPLSQYDLAKSQFNAVAGAAAAGDANSASQLTSYADAFLTASQNVNDHGAAYATDSKSVIDVLQGIGNSADALTQSFMAQQLQTQTDQVVSTLQSTSADLKAEISALRREVQIGTAQRAAA